MSTFTAPQYLPPLALYVHIPWCVRKCPYCDFNSHQKQTQDLPVRAYLDAMIEDIKNDSAMAQKRKLSSIFIGGGTPSLLPNSAIEEIIQQADQIIGIESDAEITMEANPGTVEHHDFAELRTTGVTRLSLGVQSFNEQQLRKLGRIHNANEAIRAVKRAQDGGFDKLNIDLMHGLPGQTLDTSREDLVTAIDLNPSHLSWYQLTIEQNTEFYSCPPRLPCEDILVDIYEMGRMLLDESNYEQYEISAYARNGHVAQHNLNYWRFGDYLAIGAGAHGKITDLQEGQIFRYNKTRIPEDYLNKKKPYTAAKKPIFKENLTLEFMMNALRLTEGFNFTLYEERTGLTIDELRPVFTALERKGLVDIKENSLAPSPMGRQFLNNILEGFL